MGFVIRAARVEDAEAISAVRVQSWRESYSHFLSDGLLGSMDVARGAVTWRELIAGGATVAVAEVDGEVRGFAASGAPEEDNPPRDLALWLMYQLATEHGSGSGQALLDAVISDRPAQLWVAELNPRAIAFYRRNGFVADGERLVRPDWEDLAEIRMVR